MTVFREIKQVYSVVDMSTTENDGLIRTYNSHDTFIEAYTDILNTISSDFHKDFGIIYESMYLDVDNLPHYENELFSIPFTSIQINNTKTKVLRP